MYGIEDFLDPPIINIPERICQNIMVALTELLTFYIKIGMGQRVVSVFAKQNEQHDHADHDRNNNQQKGNFRTAGMQQIQF